MKAKLTPIVVILAALLAAALPAAAQDGEQVTVPLSHPSQPALVKVSVLNGSITVNGGATGQVVVESSGGTSRRAERTPPPEAAGMHRLNTNGGVTAVEDNNVVTIHTSVFSGGNLTLSVPAHTSLSLHTVNGGNIVVSNVDGDINAEDINGSITLNNVGGSIIAHGLNGRITATVSRLDESKPSSFSSLNGTIDVTLPADAHANLRMHTDQGDIYMDNGFNFQATRGPNQNPGTRDGNGMYKIQVDRSVYGTLNGGGPEIRFENFNGSIFIRKGH